MECLSYKGGHDVRERTHIEVCKRRAGLGYIDKQLWIIINTVLFKNNYTTTNLKNKAVFKLKQYCMHCYVTLLMYSN